MMPPQAHLVDRIDRPVSEIAGHPAAQLDNCQKIKCVLLGDGAVGKTSLVVSYTTNGYPTEYVPTAFDNYSVVVTVDNQPIRFQLCDTAGQDDFDSLRPLCYPNCHVFLLCFSVVTPTSFQNVTQKWLPEIRKHCPRTPVVLVGTQSDLRNDVNKLVELAGYSEGPVSEGRAREAALLMGATDYMECSALTQKNLKEVFDMAILAALERTQRHTPCKKSTRKPKRTKVPRTKKDPLAEDCAVVRKGWKKLCCFL